MHPSTPFTGTDRFEILRSLGAGSFGRVFEALDRERNLRVALKVPYDAEGQNLLLFKQEFRTLSEVSHPNLVTLFELLVQGGSWFFTMELLDGHDILSCLRQETLHSGRGRPASHLYLVPTSSSGDPPTPRLSPNRITFVEDEDPLGPACSLEAAAPPDVARVRRVFLQVAEGLLALHRVGILHRDLKPSNVIVTNEDRAVILDFGLALDLGSLTEAPGPASRITGTPAYMAPEQLEGAFSAEASDWYSFGVMLYQTLTGRLPHTGPLHHMLRQKREVDPPSPAHLLPGIPQDLDMLCMSLLSREGDQRPGGGEVLARLAPGIAPPIRSTMRMDQELGLPPCRQRELDTLLHCFETVRHGEAVLALVHGLPGMGKSSLLRQLHKELRGRSATAVILKARCHPQETLPFKSVDGVVDDLSDFLRHLPPAELRTMLPEDTPVLARLFPVLNQVNEIAQWPRAAPDLPDAREYRRRAFAAFREILGGLAARRPLVMILEDIQWGDRDSDALLLELLQPPTPPLLLLMACHSEDRERLPLLRALVPRDQAPLCRWVDVELGPLSEEESQRLALGALQVEHPAAEEIARWAAREAGGHPYFLAELVHMLRTRPTVPVSLREGLEGHLRQRLEHLDLEALRLMELLAIAGRPLDWDILTHAAGTDARAASILPHLRNGHFLRVHGSATEAKLVEPFHVRIAQTLLSRVSPGEKRSGHLALARAYERLRPDDVRSLAVHFIQADVPSKAAHYTELAAGQALQAFAFDQAAELYQTSIAYRHAEDPDIPRLYHHLADALAMAGRGPEAARAYLRLVELQPGQDEGRLLRRASEELFRSGHVEEAIATLAPTLKRIGEPFPRTQMGALFRLICSRSRLRLVDVSFHFGRHTKEVPTQDLERVDILWAMAMGLGPVDLVRGADYQARQLIQTLKVQEPFRMVRALAHETIYQALSGNRNLKKTQETLARTRALADRLDHPNPRGRALIAQGLAALLQGHWKATVEPLEQAEVLLRDHCRGLDYEIQIAQEHSLLAHAVMGDLSVVIRRLPALIQTARDRGSRLTQTYLRAALGHYPALAQDDPEGALAELREAMQVWPQGVFQTVHYHALVNGLNAELYGGWVMDAAAHLRRSWPPLRHSLVLQTQALKITCLELRARTTLAEAFLQGAGHRRKRLLSLARHDIKSIRRERTAYGEALALKLMACVLHAEARQEEAVSALQQAIAAFNTCDMRLHTSVCERVLGGWLRDTAMVQQADARMLQEGIARPECWTAMHFPIQ